MTFLMFYVNKPREWRYVILGAILVLNRTHGKFAGFVFVSTACYEEAE